MNLSPTARLILQHMRSTKTDVYGYGVIKALDISHAATYKALYALEDLGLVEGWTGEVGSRGTKRRRYYELTPHGRTR